MRLIDADALRSFAEEKMAEGSILDKVFSYEWAWTLTAVDKMPTIDPESLRPKGEWIPFENRWIGRIPWSGKECSYCKTTIGCRAEYKFCPNCGADMRGEN